MRLVLVPLDFLLFSYASHTPRVEKKGFICVILAVGLAPGGPGANTFLPGTIEPLRQGNIIRGGGGG